MKRDTVHGGPTVMGESSRFQELVIMDNDEQWWLTVVIDGQLLNPPFINDVYSLVVNKLINSG